MGVLRVTADPRVSKAASVLRATQLGDTIPGSSSTARVYPPGCLVNKKIHTVYKHESKIGASNSHQPPQIASNQQGDEEF